jgi:hypothetical protein
MNPASSDEPLTSPDEDDWSHFEDTDDVDDTSTNQQLSLAPMLSFPPQLHPAVSLGVQRVSSCYFSLGSQESVADLLSQFGEDEGQENSLDSSEFDSWNANNSADILYHDILMNVFTFLDAQSLASFSQTARRPNFEVFYFLQLQLQRALLVAPFSCQDEPLKSHDDLSAIAGVSCLSRLASLDLPQAQGTVEEYLQSNSTLRTMPLSHSVAYMRHVLQRHGFHNQLLLAHNSNVNVSPSHALASAALLVTVVGAASMMTGDAGLTVPFDSFGTELPNMLFRVGFVGSLMKAARQMSDTEHRASMRETAEQMARTVQELPSAARRTARTVQQKLPSALLRKDRRPSNNHDEHGHPSFRLPSLVELRQMLSTTLTKRESQPMLSNPYDHLPVVEEKKDDDEMKKPLRIEEDRKMSSGCVGAYSRAIQKAATCVTNIVKERRAANFLALSPYEQHEASLAFLDACSSDESLSIVKEMIHTMDVDGFYMGYDGSETCALHTAAFHGASKVLEFLCQGVDDSDPQKDGGLSEINRRDNNGWTALHFAAGADSVPAIQVLKRHGAELSVTASNGYTPLQWAARLSNEAALKELTNNGTEQTMGWMSSQPLTTIANRFFSLIPSH